MSYPYNNLPENTEPRVRPRSRGPFLFFVAAMLLLCAVGAWVAFAGTPDQPAATDAPAAPTAGATVGSATADTAQQAATGPRKEIGGDDLVHVGEDVVPGTYRAVAAVDAGQSCYWQKSADAEGDSIIDNGLPTGGRPQVTLKKGQWFESRGCPLWRVK